MSSPLLYLVAGGGITALIVSVRLWFLVGEARGRKGAVADVRDLQAQVGTLTNALMHWMERAARAESAVQGIAQNERDDERWRQYSPRLAEIDAARAKCGPDFPEDVPVGTFSDPIYVSRPDPRLDTWAYVATVEELTGSRPESGASE